MSQENVEIVRQTTELLNRGDIDGALEAAADDIELDWSNSIGPAKGIYRGKEQARALWASFFDAFDELRWDLQEIIEVDETWVVAVNRFRARGRGSQIEVDAVGAQLWTITDREPVRIKLYQSKAEALEAAGLSE